MFIGTPHYGVTNPPSPLFLPHFAKRVPLFPRIVPHFSDMFSHFSTFSHEKVDSVGSLLRMDLKSSAFHPPKLYNYVLHVLRILIFRNPPQISANHRKTPQHFCIDFKHRSGSPQISAKLPRKTRPKKLRKSAREICHVPDA